MKVAVCLLLAVVVAVAYAAPRDQALCGPVCMIYCPFGNVLDSNGCPTCSCNWPTSNAPSVEKKALCFNAQMALCDLWCPSGRMAHDANGCPLCKCDNTIILPD
ncbi:BPTI/Kunitz domain-containing protein 4-like [Haliotis cracherodii]|uniref:BPTI/Kunitz domain-containing protein 4-like n=1 Tax=Haliotis cracherodii TaxID=6455 RepID=UPI0039E75468